MRIVELIPGTGTFLCGSCLRDTTLARALRRRDHDVDVVPLYLPLAQETPDADGRGHVRMGGINVFLRHSSSLFRHVPRAWTGWLDANPLLRFGARRGEMTDPHDLGPITVSMLEGSDGKIEAEVTALATALASGPRPDVVILSNALLIGTARALRERLEVPVVCTLQGEAPFLDALPEPHRARAWERLREHAADVTRFVAVSHDYGTTMRKRLGLGTDRVRVAWNGIDVDDLSPADAPPAAPTIGYLARLCPEKGLDTLIEAFLRIDAPADLRLRVAGVELAADRPFVRECRRRVEEAGRADRVEFLPNVSREQKVALLRSLSVLSVPATYGESFGLYLLEAWACGVPVVQPRHGAFPELLDDTGGGRLCAPDDPEDLAAALSSLLGDETARVSHGAAGRAAVVDRFTSDAMAARVEDALDAL